MKFFSRSKKKNKPSLRITDSDKEWVEENLQWLIQSYGYPKKTDVQFRITEEFFPKTFSVKNLDVHLVLEDLANLLHLDHNRISIETHKDLRDSAGLPFEIEGVFESDLEELLGGYRIHIANGLTKSLGRLVFSLIRELVKVRLKEDKLDFDTGEDSDLFIFIAGVYLGFGLILVSNLVEKGQSEDLGWVAKWNYVAPIPREVLTYSLALYSRLHCQDAPIWIDELPSDIRELFDSSMEYLSVNPPRLINDAEQGANELYLQSQEEYFQGEFDDAITTLKKIPFLTSDAFFLSDVYNNIGYYQIRLRSYEISLDYFLKSIELDAENSYAYSNMGFALIQSGKLEEGREQLDIANELGGESAYLLRNFGVYHLKRGELDLAENFFVRAFDSIEDAGCDGLEFFFACLLLEKEDTEQALKYLEKSASKGDLDAVDKLNDLSKN